MEARNATILCRHDVPIIWGGKICPTSSRDKKCLPDCPPIWPEAQDGSRTKPQTNAPDLGDEIGGTSRQGFESSGLRRVARLIGFLRAMPAQVGGQKNGVAIRRSHQRFSAHVPSAGLNRMIHLRPPFASVIYTPAPWELGATE
jgi:hypothetical protein